MRLNYRFRPEIPTNQWDDFVEHKSDDAWLWHLNAYQDAYLTWPGRRDLSFSVFDEERGLVGICPVHLVTRKVFGLFRAQILESFGGPALRNGLSATEKSTVVEAIKSKLNELAGVTRIWEIRGTISALAPSALLPSNRVNGLVNFGFETASAFTWMIHLNENPNDAIERRYSETVRNLVRKAKKQSYKVREALGPKDLDIYYQLHLETCARSKISPHPFSYFELIFNRFVPAGRSRILFCEDNGTVVAAQNTAIFKKAAWYWTGASRSQKNGIENYLLCDAQIQHAKLSGCEWYEMGEAFPNETSGKRHGLSEFKRRFGAQLFPFPKGRIPSQNLLKGITIDLTQAVNRWQNRSASSSPR